MTDLDVAREEQRRLALLSAFIVLALSSVSQTVIATAMPRIAAELSGLHLYAWATTAYLLASTVTVPVWGKLGDVYGRKPVLLWGVAIFLLGSCLAGVAGAIPSLPLLGGGMTQLIGFRVIQGIGAGSLLTSTFALIADLYSPRERATLSGMFVSVYGLGTAVGPLLGGFLTDHGTLATLGVTIQGWRWVFLINLPFGLLAGAMIWAKMPAPPPHGVGRVDYLGAALLVAGLSGLLLAASWSADHAWTSPLILGLLGGSALVLALFVRVEQAVRDPILPLSLFVNRTFVTANSASFMYSLAFMGAMTFLPLYMQVGQGWPATESGLTMLAMMGGMIVSSTVCGQLVTRTGRFKIILIGSGLVLIAGIVSLCFIGPETSRWALIWRLALVGCGLGPGSSLFTVVVQSTVKPRMLGIATSSGQLVRQMGSTMGAALFGVVITLSFNAELAQRRGELPPALARMELGDLQRMSVEARATPLAGVSAAATTAKRVVRESLGHATAHAFIFSLGAVLLGFALMLAIPGTALIERREPN